jgi:phosphoribosylamine--glycine ligase
MNILIIGGGGREHTLVWKIAQNPEVKKVYCIPGNGGVEQIAECPQLEVNDFKTVAAFAKEKAIDLTVIGPEQPLVNGITDYFQTQDFRIFGPSQKAAQMEGSKIFSKNLMAKYDIPTAWFKSFDDYSLALSYLDDLPEQPIVVKADGLAAGKGSVICSDKLMAKGAVEDMMSKRIFKGAGERVVVEEFMTGEEASLFVITDGRDYVTLTPAQDYKRARDNDEGKNTGGMGSYAPTPFLTQSLYDKTIREIVEPTLSALQSEGIRYTGVLYCGLMLTSEGPKVVEFNCRFGDPETQVVLPLLKTDLLEIFHAVQTRTLGSLKVENHSQSAICVVLTSGGYPDKYEIGKEISGLNTEDQNVHIFHAGTKKEGDKFFTSGGRVLGITGVADDLAKAAKKAYRGVEKISFENMHYRKDIGRKALTV